MKLSLVPIELREANAYVDNFHRHSKPTRGHRYSIGASDGQQLCGVAIVGRPVARALNDGFTAEVLRVCSHPDYWKGGPKARNEHPDAPEGSHAAAIVSFLYAASWRAWKSMGGTKLVTYTLADESGAALTGARFRIVAALPGRTGMGWENRPGREWDPITGQAKFRWERTHAG